MLIILYILSYVYLWPVEFDNTLMELLCKILCRNKIYCISKILRIIIYAKVILLKYSKNNFPENLPIGLWRFFWRKRTSYSTSGWSYYPDLVFSYRLCMVHCLINLNGHFRSEKNKKIAQKNQHKKLGYGDHTMVW